MPNAKTVLNITFNEVVEKIRGMRRSELIVRFCYRNCEDEEIIVKSTKASVLFRDWYGECNVCPANDTKISKLHILVSPIYTALNVNEDVTFEQFMDALEEVTVGHTYNKGKAV